MRSREESRREGEENGGVKAKEEERVGKKEGKRECEE